MAGIILRCIFQAQKYEHIQYMHGLGWYSFFTFQDHSLSLPGKTTW